MPLNIISNYAAQVAQRNLAMSDDQATSSLAKLSAGTRVLSAKDDAASLAVGSRLAAEVAGLKQASVNAGQAVSMLQIADGAMAKVNDILTRMKSLAVQAGSGQLSATERQMLDTEYQSLLDEVDRISNDTDFAGTTLVNGSLTVNTGTATDFQVADGVQEIGFRGDFGTNTNGTITYNSAAQSFTVGIGATNYTGSLASDTNDKSAMLQSTVVSLTNSGTTNAIDLTIEANFDVDSAHATGTLGMSGSNVTSFSFKVGTGTDANADDITVSVNSISAKSLSIDGTSVTDTTTADTASTKISNAIDSLQTFRARIGASQNRLEFASENIATVTENTEAARSQLLDLDVASEMSNFVSKQILIQAGVSMLAQANQLPQNLLKLFQ